VEGTSRLESSSITSQVLECVLDHVGNDLAQQRAGEFQARVRVYFDQPHLQICVYHEIQPKDLEVVLEPPRVHIPGTGSEDIGGYCLGRSISTFIWG